MGDCAGRAADGNVSGPGGYTVRYVCFAGAAQAYGSACCDGRARRSGACYGSACYQGAATKAPELTYEEDEVASPVKATFQKNTDGSLILDANGDPIPVIPEGAEVPVAYQRDENGQLVLDANGDPIVTETLPAGSSMIASIYDQLDPDRRIDIYVSYEGEELDFGVEATLTAVPKGYEAVIYTLQWQTSKDDVTWEDIPGATEAQYTVTVTEENYMDYWRVLVIIDEAQ